MTRWYRAYEGTASDPKLLEAAGISGVSRGVTIAAWHIVLEACCAARDGACTTTARRLSVMLSEPVSAMQSLLDAFVEMKMVVDGRVVAWDRRQYNSDTSSERVRKHRQAKGNVPETLHDRCETEVERSVSVSVSVEPNHLPPAVPILVSAPSLRQPPISDIARLGRTRRLGHGRLCHLAYTLPGVWYDLRGEGYTRLRMRVLPSPVIEELVERSQRLARLLIEPAPRIGIGVERLHVDAVTDVDHPVLAFALDNPVVHSSL